MPQIPFALYRLLPNKLASLVAWTRRPIALAGLLQIGTLLGACDVQASIVSDWNATALVEVRESSTLGPPIAARALAIVHTCMYDAWSAYDSVAIGTAFSSKYRRPYSERTDRNKATAISFAAYRCLRNLYPDSEERLREAMYARGYDPTNKSTNKTTPAGIGNSAALAVINARKNDGSNQYGTLSPGAYSDYTGYAPSNDPLPFCTPAIGHCSIASIRDRKVWQPLISDSGKTQVFISPHWEKVQPFGFDDAREFDDGAQASAASLLKSNGRPKITVSETSGVPYPEIRDGLSRYKAFVEEALTFSRNLNPETKLIVEYWADGPDSELPPGHWGLLAQYVSERDRHSIDKDVKMFFMMHNAAMDAGIVAWHLKRKFDGVRPITAVRYIKNGQKIRAWGGPGRPIEDIPGASWLPYNPGSNLSPAFPGFVSGHAAFSWACATVLKLFTGSDSFGYATVIPADFGRVEPNVPPVPTTLTFSTFSEAAESATVSRLFGGIHFSEDAEVGKTLGIIVGAKAWNKALGLFAGPQSKSATTLRRFYRPYFFIRR